MTTTVPTFVNCALCGHITRGEKMAPRRFANESIRDDSCGRTIAMRVKDARYPGHLRPVCSECAGSRQEVAA